MGIKKKKLLKIALFIIVIALVALIVFVQYGLHRSYPMPIDDGKLTGEAQIERGKYIAIASDCVACHTSDPKQPFAGGLHMDTPFGVIASSNITSDKMTGIGNWTLDDFNKAVRHGIGSHGYLYPAMPYVDYTKLRDQDIVDLWAYIKTIPAVQSKVVENKLPFPFNQRWLLSGWNLLFFKDGRYQENPKLTNTENHGAYLVESMGHCAMCHTPKNSFGADVASKNLHGGELAGWYASDLTSNPHLGLGKWTKEDIVSYLKTGSNKFSVSSGPMTEAIRDSLQYLTNEDLNSIADYLKTLPASNIVVPKALPEDDMQMQLGKKIYDVSCSACHVGNGSGVRNMIPAFAGNPNINSVNPASLIHTILLGEDGPVTHNNPTDAGMPSFDWRLSDDNIAAVLTYIRNSWGNSAHPVSESDIKKARKALNAKPFAGQNN